MSKKLMILALPVIVALLVMTLFCAAEDAADSAYYDSSAYFQHPVLTTDDYAKWYIDVYYNPVPQSAGMALGCRYNHWGGEIAYSMVNPYSNNSSLIQSPCPTAYKVVDANSFYGATGLDALYYFNATGHTDVFLGVGVYGGYNREIVQSTVYSSDTLYQQSQSFFILPAAQIGIEQRIGNWAVRAGYHTFRGYEAGFVLWY